MAQVDRGSRAGRIDTILATGEGVPARFIRRVNIRDLHLVRATLSTLRGCVDVVFTCYAGDR